MDDKPQPQALAHVAPAGEGWRFHDLPDHLQAVAELAAGFAKHFGGQPLAFLAGLWHDLGKYSAAFQDYIRSASGLERANAHIEGRPGRVNHSSAGALHAVARLGPRGKILAQLIMAHHAGLYDGEEITSRLVRDRDCLAQALAGPVPPDVVAAPAPDGPLSVPGGREAPGAYALWLRMLFSCLVDADFLDTEVFMDADKTARRDGWPTLEQLKTSLDAHLARLMENAPPSVVNRARARILAECRAAALREPGAFTLTVPTGGGKTLASMAFALEHALRHGKRRAIYVIPYTSIIEQTANVFRHVFGEAVVEHHSNAETDNEDVRSRLACENWDAPIIVTTTVQFFESLFAARTSRCRKLHNIVDSVVVLDEVQLLPPSFLQPILDVLKLLTKYYGVTLLLSTATQPALASREWFGGGMQGLDDSREIITDPDALYAELNRVEVRLPADLKVEADWDTLAREVAGQDDILIVVGRRADARELHRRLPKGTRHLSALMCGAHRSDVIAEIKSALAARRNDPSAPAVRVVSTQLVEAGVDLDFPVVYKAMAGLDSIAQAAGRCNREGRLQRGLVHVFVPPKGAPPGVLRMAEQAATGVLRDWSGDPLALELFRPYFERLYRTATLDEKNIRDLLKVDGDSLGCVGLREAARRFQLIDDEETGYRSVFVPYRRGPDDTHFATLVGLLRKDGPARWLLRKLQRYAVSLPGYQFKALQQRGDVEEVQPGAFVLKSDAQYDPVLGLLIDAPLPPRSMVC